MARSTELLTNPLDVCVFKWAYVRMCMCLCVRACPPHICLCVHKDVRLRVHAVCAYVCQHVHVCKCASVYVCVCACVCVCVHV